MFCNGFFVLKGLLFIDISVLNFQVVVMLSEAEEPLDCDIYAWSFVQIENKSRVMLGIGVEKL